MKKHIVLFSLIVSLFLVAFTTNKSVLKDTSFLNENVKAGGAYLTFAGEFGGEITLKEIEKTNMLGVAGCASGSLIKRFTVKIHRKNKRAQIFNGKSHLLSKQIKSALKEMKSGDTFQFSRVTAQLPTGGIVDVTCRTFRVVP